MSLRNYFYRFGKYILTFFFVTLLMVLFVIWGLKPIIKLPCDRCDETFEHIITSDQNFFNQ